MRLIVILATLCLATGCANPLRNHDQHMSTFVEGFKEANKNWLGNWIMTAINGPNYKEDAQKFQEGLDRYELRSKDPDRFRDIRGW